MGIFDSYNTEGAEKPRDYTGGFKVFDADIYEATIKMALYHKSDSGARAISFEFQLPGGDTYKEDIYFTNSEGKHKYKPKDAKGDTMRLMPGFVTVYNICMISTGMGLDKQFTENKTVKVYSSKEKKEIEDERPVLVNLLGKKVALGIRKVLENKQEKDQNGKYQTVAGTRETNKIHTVFHPEYKVTVNEAEEIATAKKEGKTPPEPKAWASWLKSNKGQIYDNRDIKGSESKDSGGGEKAKPKDDLFD